MSMGDVFYIASTNACLFDIGEKRETFDKDNVIAHQRSTISPIVTLPDENKTRS